MDSQMTCIIFFNNILSCLQVKSSIKSEFLLLGPAGIWCVLYSTTGHPASFLASSCQITVAPSRPPVPAVATTDVSRHCQCPWDIENCWMQSNQLTSRLPQNVARTAVFHLQLTRQTRTCSRGKGRSPVSTAPWATRTTSHHKRRTHSLLLPYHLCSYLIIQGDHKVPIIGGTVCLVFQSPVLGVQLYLERKERKERWEYHLWELAVRVPLTAPSMCTLTIHHTLPSTLGIRNREKYDQHNVPKIMWLGIFQVRNYLKSTSKIVFFNAFQFLLAAVSILFLGLRQIFKFCYFKVLAKMRFLSPTSVSKLEGVEWGPGICTINPKRFPIFGETFILKLLIFSFSFILGTKTYEQTVNISPLLKDSLTLLYPEHSPQTPTVSPSRCSSNVWLLHVLRDLGQVISPPEIVSSWVKGEPLSFMVAVLIHICVHTAHGTEYGLKKKE